MTVRLLLALAIAVAGCAPAAPVPLLTGNNPDGDLPSGSCYTNFASGLLIADSTYGTRIQDESADTVPEPFVPVMWPVGYTALRSGSEIKVVNQVGLVVAMTGKRYQIAGGYVGGNPRAFLSCGDILSR